MNADLTKPPPPPPKKNQKNTHTKTNKQKQTNNNKKEVQRTYLLTYAHRSWWSIGHQRPLAITLCSGLLWSFRTSWSLLFQLCFSVSPPIVARPASLSLPLPVPGQGLTCGAGCWLPVGVSDPAPLPPQYRLGH